MTNEPGTRGRGRPPVGVRVAVRVPPDILTLVDAQARACGESRAVAIRRLLVDALASQPRPDGVDRAQIRRMLALSPRDRVRHMAAVANATNRFRRAARRAT